MLFVQMCKCANVQSKKIRIVYKVSGKEGLDCNLDLFFFTFSFVVCQNSCNFAKSNYEDLRMSSSMMIFKLWREVKNTPPHFAML